MKTPHSAKLCESARKAWEKLQEIIETADTNLLGILTYKEALRYYALAFPNDLLEAFGSTPFPIKERALIVMSTYARPQFIRAFPLYVSNTQELCHFMAESEQFRGKGRGIIRATKLWFNSRTVSKLEHDFIVNAKGVPGWPLKRVLHNTRPDPGFERARRTLYRWGMGLDYTFPPKGLNELREYVNIASANETTVCGILARWGLPREVIPPSLYTLNGVRRFYDGKQS